MAARPRSALALAAFALLLVLASASDRQLLNRRPKRSPTPDTPDYTFSWADVFVHPGTDTVDGLSGLNIIGVNRTCEAACANYGLAPVLSATAALCSYKSPAANGSTVYGTWTAAGLATLNVPNGALLSTCRASVNGVQVNSAAERVTTYQCGCCGTIDRRRWPRACSPNNVAFAASSASCPPQPDPRARWTTTAGGDGNSVCLRGTGSAQAFGAQEFGTIRNGSCNIYDSAPAATWQRVCMRAYNATAGV
uniref:Apple domain-containing protein n=1 Tax=Tetradesmus obliquus TaxID=3088 RepID=A0A383WN43_TETOB|eukprot:jgi/Sobl393_1/19852/SZX78865.1